MVTIINDLPHYSRTGNKKQVLSVDCNIILQDVLADLGAAINDSKATIDYEKLPIVNVYPTELKNYYFKTLPLMPLNFAEKMFNL